MILSRVHSLQFCLTMLLPKWEPVLPDMSLCAFSGVPEILFRVEAFGIKETSLSTLTILSVRPEAAISRPRKVGELHESINHCML